MQVLAGQRVFFDTDEMQSGVRAGGFFEQLPRTQKVEAGAETGFAHHKMPVGGQGGKALAQGILFNEHITGFFQTGFVRKIHVVKQSRVGATLVIPVELGIGHFNRHGGLGIGKAAILADWQMTA